MNENIRKRFAILKWIPRVLMLGVVGFSIYVGWSYKDQEALRSDRESKQWIERDKDKKRMPDGKDPQPEIQRTSNIDYSHFDKGLLVYHVSAEKTVMLKSQQQQLEKPEFIFYDQNQQEQIRVTGKHCNISKDFNTITVFEDTRVESPNGMSVTTHQIKYDSDLQQFHTSNIAHFDWKTLKGKGKGFIYKIQTEQVILPESPQVSYVNKMSENKAPVVITGDRGMIDRQSGFAYFEGNVEVTQAKDRIKAHRIEASYKPGSNDLEKITAVKNVHVKFARPEKNSEEGQEEKVPAVPVLQQPPSMGNVFSTDAASGKDLDAEIVELYFFEDGSTIRSFHSEGDCVFVLHTYDGNDKPSEDRVIRGQTFNAEFNSNGDMEQFHAVDDVSVRLQPFGNTKKEQAASRQNIFCKELLAYFVPETGDVKEIHFNDGFKHVQRSRTVSSDQAVYYGSSKKTDLIGNPEIVDAGFTITAMSMELFEETSGIHAKGNVKSEFVRSEGKTPTTFPFSSPSNEPVYISSEDMVWDANRSEATYTDKAKLWQERNVISAAKLIINDKEKTLSAYDKVHTVFYNKNEEASEAGESESKSQTQKAETPSTSQNQAQTQPQSQTQPAVKFLAGADSTEEGPISVDASIMNYAEKDRIIHFEKEVRIVTATTRISSDRADFYLKENTSDFDKLYALGNVSIVHEQKRGTGSQATFYADERKLVLEGNPKLLETGKADIVGRVLTLFLADDRILIDGQEDGRATTTLQMQQSLSSSDSESSNANSKKRQPN